jgi:hypothetical protein
VLGAIHVFFWNTRSTVVKSSTVRAVVGIAGWWSGAVGERLLCVVAGGERLQLGIRAGGEQLQLGIEASGGCPRRC